LNSSGRGASPGQLRAWAEQREQIDAGHFDELVATLADINLAPDHPDLARHRQRWDRMARIVGPDGLRRQLAAQAARPDSLPTLQQLAMTALVVSGGADTVCRPALQVELAAGLPNARHVTLDGVGHMAPLEAPAAVAELLTRWLAD
jgi:pimeloyl-ACP methyl ester carboxylesterase